MMLLSRLYSYRPIRKLVAKYIPECYAGLEIIIICLISRIQKIVNAFKCSFDNILYKSQKITVQIVQNKIQCIFFFFRSKWQKLVSCYLDERKKGQSPLSQRLLWHTDLNQMSSNVLQIVCFLNSLFKQTTRICCHVKHV